MLTGMSWVSKVIEDNFAHLVKVRRHLHRNPELGHKEFHTVDYLERCLAGLGARAVKRPAATSLSVSLGPAGGGAIAFRADLDALPIQEENGHPYKSNHAGVMHACGHDVHTTIILGLIPVLLKAEPRLQRPVKLIFQQAEEVVPSGAPYLIDGGVLEDPTVCEIYGIHVWPHLELGEIGVRCGPLMGSLDGITFRIHSKEQADTHESAGGKDAIVIAAMLLNELRQTFGDRSLRDAKPAALLIGVINGGIAPSRFARDVVIEGSLRSMSPDARLRALRDIEANVNKLVQTVAAEIKLEVTPMLRPHVTNSERCIERVCEAVTKMPGCSIRHIEQPLSCSDDFGCYLEKIPGALVLLGSRTNADTSYPLHNPRFDVGEEVIRIGTLLLANVALHFATERINGSGSSDPGNVAVET